jgi:hypothetical protein
MKGSEKREKKSISHRVPEIQGYENKLDKRYEGNVGWLTCSRWFSDNHSAVHRDNSFI